MKRSNPYEVAFEAYLRFKRVGFLSVDEAKRSLLGDQDVKSLDFLIVGPQSVKLVVDVKGRRFPGGKAEQPRKVWQSWTTRGDIDGLDRWATELGSPFRGIIAFVYHIVAPFTVPEDTADRFVHKGQTYLMRGVLVNEYRPRMRTRSERWDTVHLVNKDFRELVRPFSEYLEAPKSQPMPTLFDTIPF